MLTLTITITIFTTLLNARSDSVAGTIVTMALTDNWLQWGLTEYNCNNLYYTLFGVMVISYMHTNSKGERGDAAYAAGRCADR